VAPHGVVLFVVMLPQMFLQSSRHVEGFVTDKTLVFDGVQNKFITQDLMATGNQGIKFLTSRI
jgi:hypothetical protein